MKHASLTTSRGLARTNHPAEDAYHYKLLHTSTRLIERTRGSHVKINVAFRQNSSPTFHNASSPIENNRYEQSWSHTCCGIAPSSRITIGRYGTETAISCVIRIPWYSSICGETHQFSVTATYVYCGTITKPKLSYCPMSQSILLFNFVSFVFLKISPFLTVYVHII